MGQHNDKTYSGAKTKGRSATSSFRTSPWTGYLVAVGLQAIMTVLLRVIEPHFPIGRYPITYVLTIMLVSYFYGVGPAALACVLGLVAFTSFFIAPEHVSWPFVKTAQGFAAWIAYFIGTFTVGTATLFMRRYSRRVGGLLADVQHELNERQQMEDALRRSESLYRSLFSSMSEGFALHEIIVDGDGRPCDYRFLEVNPAFELLTGLKRDDIIGKTVKEVLPGDEDYWTQTYGRVALTGESAHFTNYSADLGKYYEVVAYSPLSGQFATLFIDVTKETNLRKQLEGERDTLQVIMESTNAHIAYMDPQFNFLMVNSMYAKGSGHTKEELIGRNHFDLFPNEENQAIFSRVRDTGEPFEIGAKPFEFVDQPWRGVTYWDWTLTPIKDYTGTVQGLVLSLVDITDAVSAKQMSDALNNINAAINSTLDFDEMMRRVVVESATVIRAESAAITLRTCNLWRIDYACGMPPEWMGAQFTDDQVPHAVLAARTLAPVVIDDVQTDDRINQEAIADYGIQSVMVVPLVVKSEAIGALFFNHHSHRVTFSGQQVDFANKLGASISLAIQNARLFADVQSELEERKVMEEERESLLVEIREARDTAEEQVRMLQRALIPAQPVIGRGYDTASVYIPAFQGQEIGGDFYDVFDTQDGKVGILIGDVSGKGIPAAARAASARSTVRAFAYEFSSATEALNHANAVLCAQSESDNVSFVTIFLAILNPVTGRLHSASAGHQPAIVCRASGEVEFVEQSGIPVGITDGVQYMEHEMQLSTGDKLILYTDGISEARYKGVMFGFEGMERVLREHGGQSASEVMDALVDAAYDWAHGQRMDDTAVIVVERKG